MRVKKIRGLLAITTLFAMGSICFAAVEPEVTDVVFDPNDPNRTPSDYFVPVWERVAISAQLFNPDEVNDFSGYKRLSIDFNFYKGDTLNLISRTDSFLLVTEAMAVDDQNNVYTYEAPFSSLYIDSTPSYSIDPNRPVHVSIDFPMDLNTVTPVWLSEVSVSFNWLFAHTIRTVKVPFQASNQWIEILPDYSVLIEKADLAENNLSYRIKAKYEGPDDSFFIFSKSSLGMNEPIPKYIDLGITFLNEDGVNVRRISLAGGRFSSSGSGSINDYTISGDGSCDACGSVTTIQFKFAIDSYVDEMTYTLNDIPVQMF